MGAGRKRELARPTTAKLQRQVPPAPIHGRGCRRLYDAMDRDHDLWARPRPLGGSSLRRKYQVVPGQRRHSPAGRQAGFLRREHEIESKIELMAETENESKASFRNCGGHFRFAPIRGRSYAAFP